MHKPLDVFSNVLMSSLDDVKDCFVLIDLFITLSPSTARCEQGLSTMNQLKNSINTLMNQDTLIINIINESPKYQCDQLLCYFCYSVLY